MGKKRNKLINVDICDKLSFALLCILMADCCVFGAGRVLMIGSISGRMIVFALLILSALPVMITRRQLLIKNKIVWAFAAWLFWLAICAVVGIAKGNTYSAMATDIKGFLYFAALPVAVCLLIDKRRIHNLMRVMMYASGGLGMIILLHWYLYIWEVTTFDVLYRWGLECGFSAIARISAEIPRLFFRSTNYLIVGCAFATYFQVANKKLQIHLCLLTGMNLVCLLMSYTRSVYLALGVAAIALLVGFFAFIKWAEAKKLWLHLSLSVISFAIVLSAFGVAAKTDYISYAVSRTRLSFVTTPTEPILSDGDSVPTEWAIPTESVSATTPTTPTEQDEYQNDTVQSDSLRNEIKTDLVKLIKKSPFFGNGLGASLKWRMNSEYFYLELTAKTGLLGLMLYLLPMLMSIVSVLSIGKEKKRNKILMTSWISSLLGFMAFSYFNPYMNAALGVLFYSCTIAVVCTACRKPIEEIKSQEKGEAR